MSIKEQSTGMQKAGKTALMPKLRFPEFRGTWRNEPLETLGYFTGGGTPSKDNAAYWTGDIPWISSSDLNEDSIHQVNVSRFITKQAVEGSATKLVPAKSILLISRVGVGKLALSTFPLCTSQDFTNFTPTAGDPLFLAYLLKSQREILLSFNQGTSIKGFTKDDIATLRLGFPSLPEQQKIADCLNSLDEAIAAQARKVDALKKHKKGLMQQLLPREGETQPRLRFPEFQKASEWKSRTLGSVCSSFSGGTPSTSKPEYYGGDIPFIRSAEIARDKTELFLTRKGLEHSAAKLVAKGDVLIALYGANSGDVALATIGGAINQAILCLKSKESNPFICQFLSFKKDWIVATYLQGGQGNLSGEIIKSIVVSFPAPEEQKRIAACLSSLDALITTEAEKLETLKTHKRGLMQQLFPSRAEDNA